MKYMLLTLAAVFGRIAGADVALDDYIGSGPGKVPGAVVVGYADGKITARCFGYADVAAGKPMTPDTVGWLASNTKAIACALVLSYVEEGKLSMDEPVSRYLPEWRGENAPTLRQLMSHTSGLKFFPKCRSTGVRCSFSRASAPCAGWCPLREKSSGIRIGGSTWRWPASRL